MQTPLGDADWRVYVFWAVFIGLILLIAWQCGPFPSSGNGQEWIPP